MHLVHIVYASSENKAIMYQVSRTEEVMQLLYDLIVNILGAFLFKALKAAGLAAFRYLSKKVTSRK